MRETQKKQKKDTVGVLYHHTRSIEMKKSMTNDKGAEVHAHGRNTDGKKTEMFSKVFRNIHRHDSGRKQKTTHTATSYNTMYEMFDVETKKAVSAVVPPTMIVQQDCDVTASTATRPENAPCFPGAFLDQWDPTATDVWGHCFGCSEEIRAADAEVVTRMGGISIMWHRVCRESALDGKGRVS